MQQSSVASVTSVAKRFEAPTDVRANVRDLPRYVTVSTAGAALVSALFALTGTLLLIVQAATAAGLTSGQLGSWVFAVCVGAGLMTLLLALGYRQPICGAWSIAGTALLVTALPRFSLEEAAGAYLVSGLIILLLAITGGFGRAIALVPQPVVMGMLAGVLLRFGLGIFAPLSREPVLVLAMLAVFLLIERLRWQAPALGALVVGMAIAALQGQFRPVGVALRLTAPELYAPTFSLEAVLALSVPLAVLALASQNAPGIGILLAQGYPAPSGAITLLTGLGSLATALIGGPGVNVAAPMTAICASPAAHPDPGGRYAAAVLNGLLLIAFGLVGGAATSLILALPQTVIGVTAGLAMVPALIGALRRSVGQDKGAYGAFFALAIAASDVTLLGVGAAFWSLLGGLVVSRLLD